MNPATSFRRLSSVLPATASAPILALLLAAVLIGTMAAPSANAQYMYLDSNGDGVHSAADVITASGVTNFDIWLSTDTNRDGSPAVCPTADGPLGINSYVVALRAVGGTISWISTTNLQSTMGLEFGDFGSDSEYLIGYGGIGRNPAGRYRLAQFSVSAAGGTPSIEIVRSVSIYPAETTAFGSPCSGTEFDNTLKLGSDWYDADGLAFSLSGGGNDEPVVSGPDRIGVRTGERGSADYQVTDANGDLVGLTVANAPPFVSVATLSTAPGAGAFRVHAFPLRDDAGAYDAELVASDGIHSTASPLRVDVQPGGNHPPTMRAVDPVRVVAGAVASIRLESTDSDGDAVAFALVSGPAFAEVATLHSGSTATTGHLLLHPGLCDVGSFSIHVGATSNDGTAEALVQAEVVAGSDAPSPAIREFGLYASAIVSSDFNKDGKPDVAGVSESTPAGLTVLLGDGAGNLTPSWTGPLGAGYLAVESADWNGDGNADVAVGAYYASPLEIFWGRGDGTFGDPTVYAEVLSVTEMRAGDFNGDGISDLAATGYGTDIFLLLGSTASAPGPVRRIAMGEGSRDLTTGDFNHDGRLDLAVSLLNTGDLHVLYGYGDGTFGSVRSFPTGGGDHGLVTGDWNEDGMLDLAAMRPYQDGALQLLSGDASGGFALSQVAGTFLDGLEIASTDWNGDGHLDLLPSGSSPSTGFRILLGDGGGAFAPGPAIALPDLGMDVLFTDLDSNGRPDIVWGGGLTTALNTTPSIPQAPARAFAVQNQRAIPAVQSSGSLCIRVEALAVAFTPIDVDPASLRLFSSGTGSVSEISATTAKSSVIGDSDRNDVLEYPACFAMTDISALFSLLRGKQDIPVRLEGRLVDGRRICARFTLQIIGKGTGSLAARVEPNPLNPEGTLRFAAKAPGTISIRLFDVNGRLVRTLWNARPVAAGPQDVRIDGKDSAGRTLRSGVYFYRIDGAGMNETGRFTILK